MRKYISFPRVEGVASRQAHADLPPDTYERELGKEGFFGPATHMYHRHPPTGWVDWEGPLRPRAFDLTRLNAEQASPWDAEEVLWNASVKLRFWRAPKRMDHLARNGDGDELLFLHQGRADIVREDVIKQGLTFAAFEEELKANYSGSYFLYVKLNEDQRKSVFRFYIEDNRVESIREEIVRRLSSE